VTQRHIPGYRMLNNTAVETLNLTK